MKKLSQQGTEAALERIYAELPTIQCQGLCHDSCGPIGMTDAERWRLKRAGGRDPGVVFETGNCVFLQNNRCSVYEARPLICRMWGVVPRMPCVFGCVPSREVTEAEARAIFKRVETVGGPVSLSQRAIGDGYQMTGPNVAVSHCLVAQRPRQRQNRVHQPRNRVLQSGTVGLQRLVKLITGLFTADAAGSRVARYQNV